MGQCSSNLRLTQAIAEDAAVRSLARRERVQGLSHDGSIATGACRARRLLRVVHHEPPDGWDGIMLHRESPPMPIPMQLGTAQPSSCVSRLAFDASYAPFTRSRDISFRFSCPRP